MKTAHFLFVLLVAVLLTGCTAFKNSTQKLCVEATGYGANVGVCWYPAKHLHSDPLPRK